MRALTQEVENRLKTVVIHLDDPDWEPLLEDLEVLIQTDSPSKSLHLRKQIADAMNYKKDMRISKAAAKKTAPGGTPACDEARYR